MTLLLLTMSCAPDARVVAADPSDEGWLRVVRARLEADARAFHVDGDAVQANHEALGAAVRVDTTGATFTFDVDGPTVHLGLDDDARRADLGDCQADGAEDIGGDCLRRAELDHGDVVEWWESGARGFEHGFTVASGGGELRLDVAVAGAEVVANGESGVLLELPDGNRLRYDALVAVDAEGTRLPAHMEVVPGGVTLVVDSRDAVFPVEVDPTIHCDWSVTAHTGDYLFGYHFAAGGDIDGDGYDDVVVGTSSGIAYLYLGSASGPSTTAAQSVTICTNYDHSYELDFAGDVNGDGYDELLVGDWKYTNGQSYEGRGVVFYGSAAGLATSGTTIREGNQSSGYLGYKISRAGDVDNDGYDDVIVGAYAYDDGQTDEGEVWLYLGSSTGLEATAAWSYDSDQASASLGASLGGIGDINGDGYDDIAVAASSYDNGQTNEGQVWVFHGSATGPASIADWSFDGDMSSGYFGASIADHVDVNGDGYDDLAVGWTGYSNGQTNEGAVAVFHGSSSGLPAVASWTWETNTATTYGGNDIDGVGDADGDGDEELIVGGYYRSSAAGVVWIFEGDAAGLAASPAVEVTTSLSSSWVGAEVEGAGDLDGDGFDDAVFTAEGYDGQRVFGLFGSATGYASPYSSFDWEVEAVSGSSGDDFGAAIASAGDVNGDGYGDVIVGAPYVNSGATANAGAAYIFHGAASGLGTTSSTTLFGPATTEANCGWAVAGLGDVDGDGYDDVVVGCPGYESSSATADEGMIRYYHGTILGISTSATTVESNEANAKLGFAVAGAGDVNGDGYRDVAAGAYKADLGETDEGVVWVHAGSATGMGTSASWTLDGDLDSAWFGYAVAGAGDVNADGYDDLLVGAPQAYDGQLTEGVAYLYTGSATGLSTTAAWKVGTNQVGGLGADAVAAAGDIDGDGYDDVLVGSSQVDGTYTDGGRAQLFLGTATVPSTTAAWTLDGDAASARLGYAVAGDGDFDGDGYDDALVSAIGIAHGFGTGDVRLFTGSASGLDAAPTETWEGDQYAAHWGYAIAISADVDGDGDTEVLFGAADQDETYVGSGVVRAMWGEATDSDGDGYVSSTDCDDGDPAVNPAASETCNGVDDDCNGTADDTGSTWYADVDGDGYGDPASSRLACTLPTGYTADATDCDDGDADASPGMPETCDGDDDDCDGVVDEDDAVDAADWYTDADGDGYGDPASATPGCSAPSGTVGDASDCDDGAAAVNPGVVETCDGIDDDCDGATDEADATGALTWYADADGDGYGDPASTARACTAPAGYVAGATDCDDRTASAHPGATEACDSVDNDCDGATDEAGATGETSWYRDGDEDGYGDSATVRVACDAPSGYLADASDCDDADGGISPAAVEACNDLDDDCDGAIDETGSVGERTWYADADGDGYGDAASTSAGCDAPSGHVDNDDDCDDARSGSHPGGTEYCGGGDEDCDGEVDERGAEGATTWYADVDGDGYGSARDTQDACDVPNGYVAAGDDCDDTDADVGAPSAWYTDADGDGYGDPDTEDVACTQPADTIADGTDCDDTDDGVGRCDSGDTDSGDTDSGGETADEDDTGERKDGDCGCSSTRRRSGLPWGAPVVVAMTLLVRRRR